MKNLIANILGNIGGLVIFLILTIHYANILDKNVYGSLMLFFITINFITLFIGSFLDSGLIYYLRKTTNKKDKSNYIISSILLILILNIFLLLMYGFFIDGSIYIFFIGIISGLLIVIKSILSSKILYVKKNIIIFFNYLFIYLLSLLSYYFLDGNIYIGIFFGYLLTFLLNIKILYNNIFQINYSLLYMKNIINYGKNSMGITLGNNILNYSDIYIIKYFLGLNAVANYNSVYNIYDGVKKIPKLLIDVFFPKMITNEDNGIFIKYSFIRLFYFLISLGVILSIFFNGIIEYIYGNNFKGLNLLFVVLILQIVLSSNVIFLFEYYASNTLRKLFKYNLFIVILNLLLNFILIPLYTEIGAAIATFVSYLLYVFIMLKNDYLYLFSKRELYGLGLSLLTIFTVFLFYEKSLNIKLIYIVIFLLVNIFIFKNIFFEKEKDLIIYKKILGKT